MAVQLNGITKGYVEPNLFESLTLQIGMKSRIGLIGRNGCGKSTLLKLIMGYIDPDAGSVYRAPGLRLNYLSQEPRISPELTLEAEMQTVFSELNDLKNEEDQILQSLQNSSLSEEAHLKLAKRLDQIHHTMHWLDADTMDARIGRILKGLGFSLDDYRRKTGEFSGGWQMRINLAKVLLEGADILLLDEPTNHLDLEACEWLESFLKDYPGGLVIVSHDRRFLDQVATEIAEMENGALRVWTGNYSGYLEQKDSELEIITAAYERQQKELSKQEAFVERFRASATRSTQAKSREKQLEKIERIHIPKQDLRRMRFKFPTPEQSGRQVLALRSVSKAFGDKSLFDKLNSEVLRHQRIFLLGANGTGKTTLLKLILGEEPVDSGEVRQGHNCRIGYFSQNQLDTLNPELTVFETLQQAYPKYTNTELRTLLGCFLFTGEDVFKKVAALSGGEKSKLALAKLMLSGANLLLLDEPTNHMDIASKEVMAQALLEYEGSILCISHDRYFIQELATHVWEIYNQRLLTYDGDYEYYLWKKESMRSLFAPELTKPTISVSVPSEPTHPGSLDFRAKKELEKQFRKVEKAILKTEEDIAALEAQLHDPARSQEYPFLQTVSKEIETKQAELSALNDEWTELADKLSE